MRINKEKLFELYMEKVNEITEECDWKTHFTPQECVNLVANILMANEDLIERE